MMSLRTLSYKYSPKYFTAVFPLTSYRLFCHSFSMNVCRFSYPCLNCFLSDVVAVPPTDAEVLLLLGLLLLLLRRRLQVIRFRGRTGDRGFRRIPFLGPPEPEKKCLSSRTINNCNKSSSSSSNRSLHSSNSTTNELSIPDHLHCRD